jgi:hypothetical protein
MLTIIPRSNDRLGEFEKHNETSIGRLDNFFEMPWGRGSLWDPMEPHDIAAFFFTTARELTEKLDHDRDRAIWVHQEQRIFKRAVLWIRGWEPPHAPSIVEILDELTERCRGLIGWINLRIHLNLASESELKAFKMKVEEVIVLIDPPRIGRQ